MNGFQVMGPRGAHFCHGCGFPVTIQPKVLLEERKEGEPYQRIKDVWVVCCGCRHVEETHHGSVFEALRSTLGNLDDYAQRQDMGAAFRHEQRMKTDRDYREDYHARVERELKGLPIRLRKEIQNR